MWLALALASVMVACEATAEAPQLVPGLDATFARQDVPAGSYAISAEDAVARVFRRLGDSFGAPEEVSLGSPEVLEYGVAACVRGTECFGFGRPPGPRPAWLVAWTDRGQGKQWARVLIDAETSEILAEVHGP